MSDAVVVQCGCVLLGTGQASAGSSICDASEIRGGVVLPRIGADSRDRYSTDSAMCAFMPMRDNLRLWMSGTTKYR